MLRLNHKTGCNLLKTRPIRFARNAARYLNMVMPNSL